MNRQPVAADLLPYIDYGFIIYMNVPVTGYRLLLTGWMLRGCKNPALYRMPAYLTYLVFLKLEKLIFLIGKTLQQDLKLCSLIELKVLN